MCDSTGHGDPTTYDKPPTSGAFDVESTDPLTLRASGRTYLPNVMHELKAAGMVRRDPYPDPICPQHGVPETDSDHEARLVAEGDAITEAWYDNHG